MKTKQVFISHATADAQFANRLADDLRQLGVQVWIAPESIRPGESWVDAIERGLGESSHTVIVLTPKALKSRWVKKEIGVAIAQELKGRIQVIPLDVEPCAVPLLLSSYQMVSFHHDYDAGLSQLADILGVHVTPPEPVHPLWVRGVIGGLILLAVVGGALLVGRGEPTPAPIAEVSTPVVSDLFMSHSPNKLLPGEEVGIWVNVAVADQNTPVAYTWSTEGGRIVRGQGVEAIIYKAPDTPDTYGVSLKIEYGDWDTERSAPIVVVSPTPTLTSTPTATPTSWVGQSWVNLRSFPSPAAGPSGIVRVADSLWVIVHQDRRLYRLNLEGDIVTELDFIIPCLRVAWDGESLWCTHMGNTVQQLDPASGQKLTEFEIDMDNIRGITWDGSALWIIDVNGNLARYDRAGQRLRRLAVAVNGWPIDLAWVAGELWVVDVHGILTRFDSEFAEIGSFNLSQCGAGPFPYDLALYWDGESLWLADSNQDRILQCAPAN